MIFIITLILTGIFKAISDTLVHHYSKSIFSHYNPKFFDPSISWLNKYVDRDVTKGIDKRKFQPLTDAWHLSNSLMISSFILLPFVVPSNSHGIYGYIVAGLINVLSFNLLYNHLLIIKQK